MIQYPNLILLPNRDIRTVFRMKKVSFTLTTVSDVARGLLLTADGRQHEDGEGHQPHARRVAQHVTQHCS